MGDVQSLNVARAVRENDNMLLSPLECVQDAAREIASGERVCDKALVLTLDTTGTSFRVGYYASQLRSSDMLALVETFKMMVLKDMGYLE